MVLDGGTQSHFALMHFASTQTLTTMSSGWQHCEDLQQLFACGVIDPEVSLHHVNTLKTWQAGKGWEHAGTRMYLSKYVLPADRPGCKLRLRECLLEFM